MEAEWLEQYRCGEASSRPALLDLRKASSYLASHAVDATHFDGLAGPDGLLERLNELPPPQARARIAIVVAGDSKASEAVQVLQRKGFSDVLVLDEARAGRELPHVPGPLSRALWAPAPLVARVLAMVTESVRKRTALDIGAGSGRDAAYLALAGWRVTVVDRDAGLINKATRLGGRRNQYFAAEKLHSDESGQDGSVDGIVRTFGAHLKEDSAWFCENAASLLLVVRFLRRGVLELLPNAVAHGGFVVYEHFLRGCEEFGGPMKAAQMLEHGELRKVFCEARGFAVVRDDEERLADGRPVARFVARRVGSSPRT